MGGTALGRRAPLVARRQATENPARGTSASSAKGRDPGGASERRKSPRRRPPPQASAPAGTAREAADCLFSPLDAEPPPNAHAQGPGPPTSPTLSEKKADAFRQ